MAGAASATAEVLEDLVRVLGRDHPRTLTARHNLAEWRTRSEEDAGTPG